MRAALGHEGKLPGVEALYQLAPSVSRLHFPRRLSPSLLVDPLKPGDARLIHRQDADAHAACLFSQLAALLGRCLEVGLQLFSQDRRLSAMATLHKAYLGFLFGAIAPSPSTA